MSEAGSKQEGPVQPETSKVGYACLGLLALIVAGIFGLVILGGGLR